MPSSSGLTTPGLAFGVTLWMVCGGCDVCRQPRTLFNPAIYRKSNLLNLSAEERVDAMERLKTMTARPDGVHSPAGKKGGGGHGGGGGILSRIRRERQRKQEDRLSAAENRRLKMEAGLDGLGAPARGYDSVSASMIEAAGGAPGAHGMGSRAASRDILEDMPVSGPGRQPTVRRGSFRSKKKIKLGGSSAASAAAPSQFAGLNEQRHSVTSANYNADGTGDSAASVEEDFFAMQELGDQVDEYYYGVRIFPGQDPAQVWVGWVTPHYHSYLAREFNIGAAVRKCRFNEMDHHGIVAESVEYRNCYMLNALDLLNAVSDSTNTKVSGKSKQLVR